MKSYSIPVNFLTRLSDQKNLGDKKKFPKISIVMPCYNQVRFIERSILSILNQDYPNIELIIIDGGSKDGTIDIIKKYSKYIYFWNSEKDKGQSDALNKGFRICSGDIYGWLNSDDIYLPEAFKNASEALIKHQNKNIIFGDFLWIDKQDNILDFIHAFEFNLNQFKYEGFHLNAQSMFWRAKVHERFSGFDTNLINTMDYQMILEFGIKEGENIFLLIPYALGGFRRYEGQKTGGMPSRVIYEHKALSEKYNYKDKFKFTGKLKRIYFRFRRAWWYIKRGGLSNLIYRLKRAYDNHT